MKYSVYYYIIKFYKKEFEV